MSTCPPLDVMPVLADEKDAYLCTAYLGDKVGLLLTESIKLLAVPEHLILHRGQPLLGRSTAYRQEGGWTTASGKGKFSPLVKTNNSITLKGDMTLWV